jgi:hypothetical protein
LTTLLGVGCGSSTESVSERCHRVRDRLIQLEIPLTDGKRDVHAQAMRRAMGDQFMKRCTSSLSAAQHACVLEASDSRTAFACLTHQVTEKESR